MTAPIPLAEADVRGVFRRVACRFRGHRWIHSRHPALSLRAIPLTCARCGIAAKQGVDQ